jgi:penicillin-binding protein 1A
MIRHVFIFVTTALLTFAMVGVGLLVYLVYYYSQDLPDYHQLESYTPPMVTRLYTDDGRLVQEYAKERRVYVPIDNIPKPIIQAFLAAEDKNFYSHPGVDFLSVARAIVQNITNIGQGKSLVGGSTITQQVVKNFLLTNERSLSRKVREAILSFRITQVFSKDKILELYLNQIYLGGGAYGVAVASLTYFDKPMSSLTIEEVAMLAAMPKAPSSFDPHTNYDRAKTRRDWVISRMLEEEYITEAQAEQAVRTPIVLKKRDPKEIVRADFFAESVRQMLAEQYGNTQLYEGGMVVYTTLNPELQRYAEIALRRGLLRLDQQRGYRKPVAHLDSIKEWQKQLDAIEPPVAAGEWHLAVVLSMTTDQAKIGLEHGDTGVLKRQEMIWAKTQVNKVSDVLKVGDVVLVERSSNKNEISYQLRQIPELNGGLVVMDPHTGRVLALVGGYYFGDSQYNRVTQAKRQTGSIFKSFVYLAALEQGIPPTAIVDDAPIEMYQGENLPMWTPKNYKGDFLGPITLRTGLEKSRNVVTIRIAQAVGLKKVIEVTKRFGIAEKPPENFAIVLGAAESTLLSMTNAYAMLANGGRLLQPSLIERIQDRLGKTIYRRDGRYCEACVIPKDTTFTDHLPPLLTEDHDNVTDPRTAYQMVSLLEGAMQRGTGRSAMKLGRVLAGKTGTTNDSKDTWFVGMTPDLVVGAYIGYDTPRTLGKSATGGTVALPIFIDFMEQAAKLVPDRPFPVPPGIAFVGVDRHSGIRVDGPIGGSVIQEAFKTGTEPPIRAGIITLNAAKNGGYLSAASPDIDEQPDSSSAIGTGALY